MLDWAWRENLVGVPRLVRNPAAKVVGQLRPEGWSGGQAVYSRTYAVGSGCRGRYPGQGVRRQPPYSPG